MFSRIHQHHHRSTFVRICSNFSLNIFRFWAQDFGTLISDFDSMQRHLPGYDLIGLHTSNPDQQLKHIFLLPVVCCFLILLFLSLLVVSELYGKQLETVAINFQWFSSNSDLMVLSLVQFVVVD